MTGYDARAGFLAGENTTGVTYRVLAIRSFEAALLGGLAVQLRLVEAALGKMGRPASRFRTSTL